MVSYTVMHILTDAFCDLCVTYANRCTESGSSSGSYTGIYCCIAAAAAVLNATAAVALLDVQYDCVLALKLIVQ
jgi:hypothetical protein